MKKLFFFGLLTLLLLPVLATAQSAFRRYLEVRFGQRSVAQKARCVLAAERNV